MAVAALLWCGATGSLFAEAQARPVPRAEFERQLQQLRSAGDDAARVRQTRQLFPGRQLSSLQVKAIAQTITSEDSRLEFALAAFPHTVDPENFYEVYDAFQSFSNVFRLHDRTLAQRPLATVPVGSFPPLLLTDAEVAELAAALKKEPFDNVKLRMGRQALAGARGRILSRHVRDLLKLFAFEEGRLELAKAGYDCVADPWNYFVVNDAFTFSSSRESLARYLDQQSQTSPPPRGR